MARTTSGHAPGSSSLGARILVLDNGAHAMKAGFALPGSSDVAGHCHIVSNCIARSQRDKRTYVGPELAECLDFGELQYRRPVEKGFVVSWESQKAVWGRTFLDSQAVLPCEPGETTLMLTEAPNAPAVLQRNADEMVFEEFEFTSYYRTIAPALSAFAPSPFAAAPAQTPGFPLECILVVDVGHSHTTITPLYHGRPIHAACRRLEIGGKTLTNHLKNLISRTFDVHREDWIVGEIKEDVCFVSQSFTSDLERAWKGGSKDPRPIDPSIVVDYVLPDYETIKRGFARAHDPRVNLRNLTLGIGTEGGRREHILTIGNERFVVPELLFTPSDIGMQQEGICGTILQSIDALPTGLRQAFLANILVVGGTSKLPGFVERLEADLRSVTDVDTLIRVARAEDPVTNAWLGGTRLAQNEDFMRSLVVTRDEYLENGDLWTRRRFAGKIGR